MIGKPVLLVTGASSGIGAATAWKFAGQGYRVALVARRLERLQALAAELEAAGCQALPIAADLSQLADIQRASAITLEQFGQIDVLFNNAGFGRLDFLETLDPQTDIAAQLQVNLLGLIQMTRTVLPHMIARRQGQIINMSSVAGLIATPTYSIYAASKFGVRGFSEALRREVGIYGIHVSVIYPGAVATEFAEQARIHRKTKITTPAALKLSAETVAEAVWGLARRPRQSLILPWPMRWTAAVNTFFPGLVDWAVERWFVRRERGEIS